MNHQKYSQNIYVYQLKYLNEWKLNKKKNFQALKSDLPTYKHHIVFARLMDFLKVIGESHELCKLVRSFYELHKSCFRVPRTS